MEGLRRTWAAAGIVAVLAVVSVGCSDDSDGDGAAEPLEVPEASPLGDDDAATLAASIDDAGPCDVLDEVSCGLPFPSDQLTVPDSETDSGRSVALPDEGLLANTEGTELDVTEWNRNDGFSPGTPIMTSVPDVDLEASGAPLIGDIARSLEDDPATVLVDLSSGERLPHWVELDAKAADGADPLLIIRPAANLPEGARVGVGLRGLIDSSGAEIEAPLAFQVYRDNLTTELDPVEERRPAMEEVLAGLHEAGVERESLYLAWDFTVASEANLSERMLHLRDDAFDQLGEDAPSFEITGESPGEHDGIARVVDGTVEVPLYLDGGGEPGSRFRDVGDSDGLPEAADETFTAGFTCQVPEAALDAEPNTTRMVVYGHGLLGNRSEVTGSQVAMNAVTNGMTFCATDWIGMSTDDIGYVATVLQDTSNFPAMADRMQQGILNTLFLARVMIHPDGLGSDEAFQNDGEPLPATDEAYFYGNSQGAIMGGAATAVAQDWTKAVLGVPGMNYSTLLDRSTDYSQYEAVLTGSYPDRVDQLLVYGLMQMLWDRGEANGYAAHLTDDPLPDTPEHQVLLHVAFGDQQVAQVTAETMARSAGIPLRAPALGEGRHPDEAPFFGLDTIDDYPFDGSALVFWDTGTVPPPSENVTPRDSDAYVDQCGDVDLEELDDEDVETVHLCADPHEDPRRSPDSMAQVDEFFQPDGVVVDPCDGEPCTAEPRSILDY
jgi:hypothetical protein